MKNQKLRLKLALRTETVRAIDAAQLSNVVGGNWSLPPICKMDPITFIC